MQSRDNAVIAHNVARTWFGGNGTFATAADWTPNGAPRAGDTAIIKSGGVTIGAADGAGVNFSFQKIPGQGNPASLDFTSAGSYSIGTIRASADARILLGDPGRTIVVTTAGIHVWGAQLSMGEFNSSNSTLIVQGDSSVDHGGELSVRKVGTGGLPAGRVENDGTMRVDASTLVVGALTGKGVIHATGNSTVTIDSASASETIQLQSGNLHITSGQPQFLAPITNFGANSTITLDVVRAATSEMFVKSSPRAGELFVYNGSTVVADLHISGQANIYAEKQVGSVLLTAHDTGHSLPMGYA